MANKHMKRNLTLLVIRKMQVKTTIRYNFTLTRISKTITNADKDVKKWELIYCWSSYSGKQSGGSSND